MEPPAATEAAGRARRCMVELVPLGAIHEMAADVVAGNLQAILDLPTDVLPPLTIPEDAFMSTRRQYDAARVIAHLSTVMSTRAPICLGLTGSDLGTPILTYVYGESQLGGRVAVVSLYRLTKAGRQTTLERLSKLCLHEVGHVLGIGHCWEHSCLMRSIRNIDQLDMLEMVFCASCSYELDRRIAQLKKRSAGSKGKPGAASP